MKKIFLYVIIFFVSIISLAAKAADTAKIVLIRNSNTGIVIYTPLSVNGHKIGTIEGKGYLECEVPAGEVSIEGIGDFKDKILFNAEKGETYYVMVKYHYNMLTFRLDLQLIGEEKAKKNMKKLMSKGFISLVDINDETGPMITMPVNQPKSNKNLTFRPLSTSVDSDLIDDDRDSDYPGKTEVAQTSQYVSDVDRNIPVSDKNHPETFVLVISNENYEYLENVNFAHNDGEVFAEYCLKTLGLPEENIHLIKNATMNNIKRELNLMGQIAEAYKGEAAFIIYYAGHGIPDESNGNSYLLPVDGYPSDLTTCYSLTDFYSKIGKFASRKTVVFIDACFSGSLRGDGMLQAARGVALKAKPAEPEGKMVVFSAAQGDETAYPVEKERHGLFTYWLLKNIKDSEGKITLGELSEKLIDEVGRQSLVINGKKQTPGIQISPALENEWQRLTINDD